MLGATLGLVGKGVGPHDAVLGAKGSVLGAKGSVLGAIDAVLGAGRVVLGAKAGLLGALDAVLGAGPVVLGAQGSVLGAQAGVLGVEKPSSFHSRRRGEGAGQEAVGRSGRSWRVGVQLAGRAAVGHAVKAAVTSRVLSSAASCPGKPHLEG